MFAVSRCDYAIKAKRGRGTTVVIVKGVPLGSDPLEGFHSGDVTHNIVAWQSL